MKMRGTTFRFQAVTAAALALCLLLAFSGCSRERAEDRGSAAPVTEAPTPRSDAEGARSADSEARPGLPSAADPDVAIEFMPAQPTVEDDLWALLRGATGEAWRWQRNGFEIEGAETDHLSRSRFSKGDEIRVVVDTGKGILEASTVIGNAPPRVDGVSLENLALRGGEGITANPSGVDGDGDPVTFDFVWTLNGIELSDLDGPALPRERFREGDRVGLKVTPSDGETFGKPFAGEEIVIPNAPPFFTSIPPAFSGFEYLYQVRASDPDGDPVTCRLEEAPRGMKIDAATGKLAWKVPADASGDRRIKIAAEDGNGARSVQEFHLRITPGSLP